MQMYSKPKKFSCEDEKFDEEVFMLFIWKSKKQIDSPGLKAAVLCRHGKNCKTSKFPKFEIGNRNTLSHALVYICIIKPLVSSLWFYRKWWFITNRHNVNRSNNKTSIYLRLEIYKLKDKWKTNLHGAACWKSPVCVQWLNICPLMHSSVSVPLFLSLCKQSICINV